MLVFQNDANITLEWKCCVKHTAKRRMWDWFCVLLSDPFQSAAFTGVYGYAIAGVWLLCGLALGISMIIKCQCGGSVSLPFKEFSEHYHILLFLLILFLTSLAMYVIPQSPPHLLWSIGETSLIHRLNWFGLNNFFQLKPMK